MKNFSTRCMNGIGDKTNESRKEGKSMPCRQTLDFLTQFARVYHSEPMLHSELCSLILN